MTVSSRNDEKRHLWEAERAGGENQWWESYSLEWREKDLQSFATLKGTNVAGGSVEGRDEAKGTGEAGKEE